jgi:hypothetical protein
MNTRVGTLRAVRRCAASAAIAGIEVDIALDDDGGPGSPTTTTADQYARALHWTFCRPAAQTSDIGSRSRRLACVDEIVVPLASGAAVAGRF